MTALALAVPLRVASAAPTVEDGQRDFDAGRFEAARTTWAALAEAGDAEAAFRLGILYDLGRGVPSDPAEALRWYKRAGEGGLPAAELNAAFMYDRGRGTRRDASEAALWYARAAAHGNHRAEYDLGQLYEAGDGVPRNLDLAAAWLRQAAAGGLEAASQLLTILPHLPKEAAEAQNGGGNGGVILLSPADAATLRRSSAAPAAELVWTLPAQTAPVRFFVEVVALDPAGTRPVFADYMAVSAVVVKLPGGGSYGWRVYTVQPTQRSYSPSAWRRFSVASGDIASSR